jgi:hypothetical protein
MLKTVSKNNSPTPVKSTKLQEILAVLIWKNSLVSKLKLKPTTPKLLVKVPSILLPLNPEELKLKANKLNSLLDKLWVIPWLLKELLKKKDSLLSSLNTDKFITFLLP